MWCLAASQVKPQKKKKKKKSTSSWKTRTFISEQLFSEQECQLPCLWEIQFFIERYCTQIHACFASSRKFMVFIKSISSSPANIWSPKQILKWLLKNSWSNVEIVSFGKVSLLLISLRPRGNTSCEPGLPNIHFLCVSSDLCGRYIIHGATLDTNTFAMNKEQFRTPTAQYVHEVHIKFSCRKTLISCSFCVLCKLLSHHLQYWCTVFGRCTSNIKAVFFLFKM